VPPYRPIPAASAIAAVRNTRAAAVLGDLEGEHRSRAFAGQVEGVLDTFDGFVGHDRRRARQLKPGHASAVVARDRLFDQVDSVVAEHLAGAQGDGFIPGLVDIDAHAGALARLFDRDHMGQVGTDLTGADLQFEDTVTAQVEHLLGFGNVLLGVAAGQGPGHRQRIAHAAAEQLADRQVQAFAQRIEQRAFDGGLGEGVAANAARQAQHGGIDVVRVLADQAAGRSGGRC